MALENTARSYEDLQEESPEGKTVGDILEDTKKRLDDLKPKEGSENVITYEVFQRKRQQRDAINRVLEGAGDFRNNLLDAKVDELNPGVLGEANPEAKIIKIDKKIFKHDLKASQNEVSYTSIEDQELLTETTLRHEVIHLQNKIRDTNFNKRPEWLEEGRTQLQVNYEIPAARKLNVYSEYVSKYEAALYASGYSLEDLKTNNVEKFTKMNDEIQAYADKKSINREPAESVEALAA